jgi:hypothetical protein
MLRLTIDGDDTVYEFDPASITNKEAKQVERFTGQRISHFQDRDLIASDADNVTMLVWLARRRNGEADLKLEDVEFRMSDVSVEDADDPTDEPVAGDPPVPTVPPVESGDGSEPG